MLCVKYFFTSVLSSPRNPSRGVAKPIKYLVIRICLIKLSNYDHQLLLGAQAFDDLITSLETLGDVKGMTWVKEQTDLLKSSKRYLKSDYKVMSRYLGFEIVLAQFWHNSPLRVQLFLWSFSKKSAAGIINILCLFWSNLLAKVLLLYGGARVY